MTNRLVILLFGYQIEDVRCDQELGSREGGRYR